MVPNLCFVCSKLVVAKLVINNGPKSVLCLFEIGCSKLVVAKLVINNCPKYVHSCFFEIALFVNWFVRISYKLNDIAVTIPRILNKTIGTVSCNWDEVVPPVSYKLDEIAVTIPRILNKMIGTGSCNWDEVVPPVSYKLDEMVVTEVTIFIIC